MRVILAENKDGANERQIEFQTPVVRMGRDSSTCQLTFDTSEYPMVSRRHAQISYKDGIFLLSDLGSAFGTFLNGKKLSSATPIKAGDVIQLGQNGPVIKIILLEVESEFQEQVRAQGLSKGAYGNRSDLVEKFIPNAGFAKAFLMFRGESNRNFPITKEEFWIGRDPSCDLVIEASSVMVSRRHAKILTSEDKFLLVDNNSFNGTYLNGKRIVAVAELTHDDAIQLGFNGPLLEFCLSSAVQQNFRQDTPQFAKVSSSSVESAASPKTIVFHGGLISQEVKSKSQMAEPTLLMTLRLDEKNELRIGRDAANHIMLDSLQISKFHARLVWDGVKILLEDLDSTNGVFVNGRRVSKHVVTAEDIIQIGAFIIKVDAARNVKVYDTRARTRIDVIQLTKDVKNDRDGGSLRLLDNISLSIMPNEFVGLLGPSGAGKSTFMDALNGMRPASRGHVLINNLDLYQNLSVLKQSIGYVPQEDIIHRELTVYRTLYYVAKLRLPSDVSDSEIEQIINEVLDVTGLAERRDVLISQLSGGQRKRVSIAVELITKPSIIFLDEPTSGLDPATEEKIMLLFRQIAESGRTVILTTHAMENVKLFDKIVLLMRGKLVFYGKPQEALDFVGAKNFKELYDKLEEPAQLISRAGSKSLMMDKVADGWKERFLQTPQYRKNVQEPLSRIGKLQLTRIKQNRNLGIFGAVRQWFYLSIRYFEVLLSDKLNLAILFLQAPIIALMTFLVVDNNQTRDFIYFVLSLVSIWFGTSVAAREIIREKPIYKRERMFNLGLFPYVMSKIFVLSFIVGLQCFLLFLPLKLLDILGLMKMPGVFLGLPQLWLMFLTALVGIALGLFISALVKTSEMATSLVPLILIPQILFSGLVGVPSGLNKVIGLLMPAAWSFDAIKSFSGLDTLEPEGAKPDGETQGKGYYKWIEAENDKLIEKAREDFERYKIKAEESMKDYQLRLRDNLARGLTPPPPPKLDAPPKIENPKKIDENLSRFIVFLHPWMSEILSQIVLMLMFIILLIATIFCLWVQDLI